MCYLEHHSDTLKAVFKLNKSMVWFSELIKFSASEFLAKFPKSLQGVLLFYSGFMYSLSRSPSSSFADEIGGKSTGYN